MRCQLEQTLRGLRSVRVDGAGQWTPAPDAESVDPPVARIDLVVGNLADTSVAISGRMLDPSPDELARVVSVEVRLGGTTPDIAPLASAPLSVPPPDLVARHPVSRKRCRTTC